MNLFQFLQWVLTDGFWRFAGFAVLLAIAAGGVSHALAYVAALIRR